MYKLFYFPRNASWALHLMLEELGVDFELVLVDRKTQSQKSESYLSLNPTGRIPTLVHGERVVFESGAIALYLSEMHPEAMLIPRLGTPERALCYQWLFYLTSTIQPELMVYFYPEKHTDSTDNLVSIVAAQEERITHMFSIVDKQIGLNRFMVGDSITLCDYFLFMLCHWASGFKCPPLGFPNLGRYLKGMAARDSFRKVCDKEGTSLDIYS